MWYNSHTVEQVRKFFFDEFAQRVHEGDYEKINYEVWRQIRDALNKAPLGAPCYFLAYDDTECEDAHRWEHCILIVIPTLYDEVFSFNTRDNSFGSYLWNNVDITRRKDYGSIPFDVIEAIEKAHNDGIITLHYEVMPYTGSISTKATKSNSIKIDNKEEKNNMFNFDFGPCTHDNIRISMYGIAVKNANGNYASYDKAKKEIVDVDILNFEGGKYLYKMPVAIKDIKVGDVILHNSKPVIVTTCTSDIVAVDVFASEKKIVMPVKSPFGFDFCTKIVSLFDMNGGFNADNDNPFGNILPYVLLANNNETGDNKDALIAMMLMNSGKMDFASNPMMLYFLLGNGEIKDIDPFLLMAMSGAMGIAPVANTATNVACHSDGNPIVKLPD